MSALQEERSAETRRRLLDATVACLFERGYAGTTTTEIASRAGVSRGAQLHHFPKKDELVVSALEHVFELRLARNERRDRGAAVGQPRASPDRRDRRDVADVQRTDLLCMARAGGREPHRSRAQRRSARGERAFRRGLSNWSCGPARLAARIARTSSTI